MDIGLADIQDWLDTKKFDFDTNTSGRDTLYWNRTYGKIHEWNQNEESRQRTALWFDFDYGKLTLVYI